MFPWLKSWIWTPNVVDTIMTYCRNESIPIEDRKNYFYQHMSEHVFDQFKRPERKLDLYFIADLLVSSDHKASHSLPTTSSNDHVCSESIT